MFEYNEIEGKLEGSYSESSDDEVTVPVNIKIPLSDSDDEGPDLSGGKTPPAIPARGHDHANLYIAKENKKLGDPFIGPLDKELTMQLEAMTACNQGTIQFNMSQVNRRYLSDDSTNTPTKNSNFSAASSATPTPA